MIRSREEEKAEDSWRGPPSRLRFVVSSIIEGRRCPRPMHLRQTRSRSPVYTVEAGVLDRPASSPSPKMDMTCRTTRFLPRQILGHVEFLNLTAIRARETKFESKRVIAAMPERAARSSTTIPTEADAHRRTRCPSVTTTRRWYIWNGATRRTGGGAAQLAGKCAGRDGRRRVAILMQVRAGRSRRLLHRRVFSAVFVGDFGLAPPASAHHQFDRCRGNRARPDVDEKTTRSWISASFTPSCSATIS